MSKRLKQLIERIENWPEDRQEEATRILLAMEDGASDRYQLSDEQVAEVKRRLADPNPKFLTLEEVRARFAQRDE